MKYTVFLSMLFYSVTTFSQWNNNTAINNLVSKTGKDEAFPQAVSDGAGGSIITFVSYENDNIIYAERIRASGALAWGDSTHPVIVCNTLGYHSSVVLISDGRGGAFVSWIDDRNPAVNANVFIQHLDSLGNNTWAADGVQVTNIDRYNAIPRLCLDSAGGVYISWDWDNEVNTYQISLQHYDATGNPLWQTDGIQVCTAPGFRLTASTQNSDFTNMVTDGSGGIIIFFTDTRNDPNGLDYNYNSYDLNYDIYAQRFNIAGNKLWADTGVAVCTVMGGQGHSHCTAVSDGSNGAIVIFGDVRNSPFTYGFYPNFDIYAQRVNANGVRQWAASAIPLATNSGSQYILNAVSDGNHGAVILWLDDSLSLAKSQRISVNGTNMWTVNGVTVSDSTNSFLFNPEMIADSLGNYIFALDVIDPQYSGYIKTQKLNSAGILQWLPDGVLVYKGTGNMGNPVISNCSKGEAIICWARSSPANVNIENIYASRIISIGALAAPVFATIANGNWNNPAIWSGGVVPGPGAFVMIYNTVVVTTNTTCYSLNVVSPGTVTVNTGVTLTVLH